MRVTKQDVLRLAAQALVDPRSAAKYLAGGALKPLTHERLERAAAELGVERNTARRSEEHAA